MSVDEAGYAEDRKRMGIRSAVITSYGLYTFASNWIGGVRKIKDLGHLLRYGINLNRFGTKKKVPMNIQEMVNKWIEVMVGMSTAHTKDEFDAHDAKADDLLGPILTAPAKQIREFYSLLQETMKNDPRVPMVVWMGFDAWGETAIKNAPDESIIRLKNKLANEIAELVEGDIKDQIPGAIARALRWRDPETLEQIKEVLEEGKKKGSRSKPKLVGRQSCLFLECGKGKKKVSVML